MTTPTSEATKETGRTEPSTSRTPSMFASLLVFGAMIGLILLSVALFPDEVDAGPLQISMTLANAKDAAVTVLSEIVQITTVTWGN